MSVKFQNQICYCENVNILVPAQRHRPESHAAVCCRQLNGLECRRHSCIVGEDRILQPKCNERNVYKHLVADTMNLNPICTFTRVCATPMATDWTPTTATRTKQITYIYIYAKYNLYNSFNKELFAHESSAKYIPSTTYYWLIEIGKTKRIHREMMQVWLNLQSSQRYLYTRRIRLTPIWGLVAFKCKLTVRTPPTIECTQFQVIRQCVYFLSYIYIPPTSANISQLWKHPWFTWGFDKAWCIQFCASNGRSWTYCYSAASVVPTYRFKSIIGVHLRIKRMHRYIFTAKSAVRMRLL